MDWGQNPRFISNDDDKPSSGAVDPEVRHLSGCGVRAKCIKGGERKPPKAKFSFFRGF